MPRHRRRALRSRPGQAAAGFSMVEVLVAALIMSIGLLGLAGLQTASLRYTNSATQRFEATGLANDILERMRANPTPAVGGRYDIALGQSASGSTLAAQDLAAWKSALANLPGGDGAITVSNRIATVTVRWTDATDANTGIHQASSVVLRSQL